MLMHIKEKIKKLRSHSTILHLCFADDMLLFAEADVKQTETINGVFGYVLCFIWSAGEHC
jgi:hypothetical protein